MGDFRSRRSILVTALVALAACKDSTGPSSVDGTYALARVEERSGPPFVSSDISCAPESRLLIEITGDTIILGPAGAALHKRLIQTRTWSGAIEATSTEAGFTRSGTYRRARGGVILTYPAGEQGFVARVDTFRLNGGGFEHQHPLGAFCFSGVNDERVGRFEYARL